MKQPEFIKRDDGSRINLGLKPLSEISANHKPKKDLSFWFYYLVGLGLVGGVILKYLVS